MPWLNSLFIGFLCVIPGCIATGLAANLCVSWYRISSFEGKSAFYVIAAALLGGILSGAIGIAASRIVTTGFLPALGAGLAATAAAIGLLLLAAYIGGDIPPELNGQPLNLETELMLPPGYPLTNKIKEGYGNSLFFNALNPGGSFRGRSYGPFDFKHTRLENGRIIVPAYVDLFTSTGRRQLDFQIDGKSVALVEAPIPAHPTAQNLQWSPWLPAGDCQYRFRVSIPREADSVAAPLLTAESPIEDWLNAWTRHDLLPSDERDRVILHIQSHLDQLLPLIESQDPDQVSLALNGFNSSYIQSPSPAMEKALRTAVANYAARFLPFAAAIDKADPETAPLSQFKTQLMQLSEAWIKLRQDGALTPPPEIQKIRAAAEPLKALSGEVDGILYATDQFLRQ